MRFGEGFGVIADGEIAVHSELEVGRQGLRVEGELGVRRELLYMQRKRERRQEFVQASDLDTGDAGDVSLGRKHVRGEGNVWGNAAGYKVV